MQKSKSNTFHHLKLNEYKTAQNKQAYVIRIINSILKTSYLDCSRICLNEFATLCKQIGLDLSIQQINELFMYSIRQKENRKSKMMSLFNQERKNINIESMAKWICHFFGSLRLKESGQQTIIRASRTKTEISTSKQVKLPAIQRGYINKRSEKQLEELIQIFDEMQQLRQQNGLMPMRLGTQADTEIAHIPYEPELYQLNQKLDKLRIQAQLQLKRIVQISKVEPSLKKSLQNALQKFRQAIIQSNERTGRIGAINAKKRLHKQTSKQLERFRDIRLDMTEALLRAAKKKLSSK